MFRLRRVSKDFLNWYFCGLPGFLCYIFVFLSAMIDKEADFSPLGGAVAMILLEEVTEESLVEALDEEVDEETEEELRELIGTPEEERHQTVVWALEVIREEGGEEEVNKLVSKIADFIEPHVDKDHFEEQYEVEEEEGLEDYLAEALFEIEEEFEGEVEV